MTQLSNPMPHKPTQKRMKAKRNIPNQCMGCQAQWPAANGYHEVIGGYPGELVECTAGLYRTNEKALFIPLMTRYYEAFERGDKTEELRLYGPRWNETVCRVGRAVTLSKGYGKNNRLSGTIWRFKRQRGSTFGSTYKAAILDRYKTLNVWIACISIRLRNTQSNPAPTVTTDCVAFNSKGLPMPGTCTIQWGAKSQ